MTIPEIITELLRISSVIGAIPSPNNGEDESLLDEADGHITEAMKLLARFERKAVKP